MPRQGNNLLLGPYGGDNFRRCRYDEAGFYQMDGMEMRYEAEIDFPARCAIAKNMFTSYVFIPSRLPRLSVLIRSEPDHPV